jgi:hypothetical protein
MDNPFLPPKETGPKDSSWKIATIVTPGTGQATVRFDGEDSATDKYYKCSASYTPVAGDRVLMAWFSGSGVILCKF